MAPKFRHLVSMIATHKQDGQEGQIKVAHSLEVIALEQRWANVSPLHAKVAMPVASGWRNHNMCATPIEELLTQTDFAAASALVGKMVEDESGRHIVLQHDILLVDISRGQDLQTSALQAALVKWPVDAGWRFHRVIAKQFQLHNRRALMLTGARAYATG